MENSLKDSGYNIEMQIVAILARMEVQTTEPYSSCQNKAESDIKKVQLKDERVVWSINCVDY